MLGAFLGETLIATGQDDSDFSALRALGYKVCPINPITNVRIGAAFSSNEEAEREIAESKLLYGKDGLD